MYKDDWQYKSTPSNNSDKNISTANIYEIVGLYTVSKTMDF